MTKDPTFSAPCANRMSFVAFVQRPVPGSILNGVSHLMRRDRHRGQRFAVIVIREQPDHFGLRVIVIAEFRRLDLHVRHLEAIEQMPGQFTAPSPNSPHDDRDIS